MEKSIKRGFTLIELLVVIAIIAILAAILFPVFARARENARRTSCMSNLKQIALGVFMYNQDYDEKLPRASVNDTNVTASNPYGWADAMQPYLKSTQLFQCPSDSVSGSDVATAGQYTDYWINGRIDGAADATFDAPTMTVMLGDGAGVVAAAGTSPNDLNGGWRGSSRYAHSGTSGIACAATYVKRASTFPGTQRHLDGANFAFADGHVKWLKGTTSTTIAAVDPCAGTNLGIPTFIPGSGNQLS